MHESRVTDRRLSRRQRDILHELELSLSQLELYYETGEVALRDRSGSRYTAVERADLEALVDAGVVAYTGEFNEQRGACYKIAWRAREEAIAAGVDPDDAPEDITGGPSECD